MSVTVDAKQLAVDYCHSVFQRRYRHISFRIITAIMGQYAAKRPRATVEGAFKHIQVFGF